MTEESFLKVFTSLVHVYLAPDVEKLLAAQPSLEAARDEMKEWATTMDPLWSQFRPLAEINAHIDTKKGRINIMIIQNKEVLQFFGFSQQERLDPFFDYLETYKFLVQKNDA